MTQNTVDDTTEDSTQAKPAPAPAALASEASGQRGDSMVRAPDTRPEPGSSARAAAAAKPSALPQGEIARMTDEARSVLNMW